MRWNRRLIVFVTAFFILISMGIAVAAGAYSVFDNSPGVAEVLEGRFDIPPGGPIDRPR